MSAADMEIVHISKTSKADANDGSLVMARTRVIPHVVASDDCHTLQSIERVVEVESGHLKQEPLNEYETDHYCYYYYSVKVWM